jgi:peptidoglycan hydrolase CwlO-like protein
MDQIERLAADVQTLKNRFDDMSTRFAVSEEREKRVDDKIDAMVERLTSKLNGVERSMNSWNTTGRLIIGAIVVVLAGIMVRWMISGQLAGF